MAEIDSSLEINGMGKIYAGAASVKGGGIRPLSVTLPSGTFFTLLGPSGCGKTTTLRCIAGLEVPDEGSVTLGGDILFDATKGVNVPLNRRNFGMVFQTYAIWPHMSVFENVAFPLRVERGRTYPAAEIRAKVEAALATVNLGGFGSRSATRLSGGQQQRVALARAIVRQPRLLLLDEPLSNLDALLREGMRVELKRLQRQLGVTTVYVTHDQSEALEMSDLVAVLRHGDVVQIGTPREIYFRPANAFVAGFLGSTNLLEARAGGAVGREAMASVVLAAGGAVTCLFPHPAASGDRIAVSIRPEFIELRAPGSPRPDNTNRIEGNVLASGFLGSTNRVSIAVGDQILQASTAADSRFQPGEAVAIDFGFEQALGLVDDEDEGTG